MQKTVVQQWDSSIQPPSIDNLLVEFQIFLIEGKSVYYARGIHVGLYFMDHLIKYHHNILFPLPHKKCPVSVFINPDLIDGK
jgi:hypothetical protein